MTIDESILGGARRKKTQVRGFAPGKLCQASLILIEQVRRLEEYGVRAAGTAEKIGMSKRQSCGAVATRRHFDYSREPFGGELVFYFTT